MSKKLEIEFKSVISPSEYHELLLKFKQYKPIKQTNYYFDTQDFMLRDQHINVRIRIEKNNSTITLKKPLFEGNYEFNFEIPKQDALNYAENGLIVPIEEIRDELPTNRMLYKYAELHNTRVEFEYMGGLLSIDKSEYYDTTDYEIEFEYDDYKEGLKVFMRMLNDFNIRYKKSSPKVRRVFEEYKRKNAPEE